METRKKPDFSGDLVATIFIMILFAIPCVSSAFIANINKILCLPFGIIGLAAGLLFSYYLFSRNIKA